MTDMIHIKIADVERIRSELRAAEKQVMAAVGKVEAALRAADWKDANRREFERQLNDAKRRVTGFTADATQLDRYLASVIDRAKALGLR